VSSPKRVADAALAASAPAPADELLDRVDSPVSAARVALVSGRTYEIEGGATDRLVVRSAAGEVVLRIEVGDHGPVLSFAAAELRLASAGTLALEGADVSIRSRGDMSVDVAGALREKVGGHHHSEIDGDERLEAAGVQVLAATGRVEVVAQESVHLDGEHIGLNDNPVPVPFPWSRIAQDD
jgi:hypothetical protein